MGPTTEANETSTTKQIISKMQLIVPIIALSAVLAAASTDGKGDVKMVDLAEDLAKAREDLAKAREETKQIIKSENEKLKAEDNKLREEDVKIKKDAEKIKKDAEKIKKENQRLRKQMAKLRRDNSQIKKIQRQKDQNNTSELEKMMRQQLDQYLQVNKICVAGRFHKTVGSSAFNGDHTVDFGHAFPRVPTFTASLSSFRISSVSSDRDLGAPLSVQKVTNSFAVVGLFADTNFGYFRVAWMACL